MKKIKVRILYALYSVKSFWYRLRGIRVGKKCFISAWPHIHKHKNAEILIGNNVTIHSKKKYNRLITHPTTLSTEAPGAKIELKDNCGISGSTLICTKHISIGRYTIVGAGTVIHDCKAHEYSPKCGWMNCGKREGKPIIIGERCYIGMNCIILKGVTIGDNCVISAGTIIKEDVPAGHLAQGNPPVYTPLPAHLLLKPKLHS